MKRNNTDGPPVDRSINTPTSFGPPIISPGVIDPTALRYAKEVTARHGVPLDKYTTPVAGGSNPPIPLLSQEAVPNMTMADQARSVRMAQQAPAMPGLGPSSMFQGSQLPFARPDAPLPQKPSTGPKGLAVLPSDLLPEEARSDPQFVEGAGSMYAINQPQLAARYGVIRNKQRLSAAQMGAPTNRSLRPETLEGLKAIQELQEKRATAESSERKVEKEVASGPAGAAARYGTSPGVGPEPTTEEERQKLQEALKNVDDFDLHKMRDLMKDMLNSDEQKKTIEDRLSSLDMSDLIVSGYIRQRVPIIVDKFEPTFESTGASEDLAIKRLIMLESKSIDASDRYLLDKFSIMSVVLGVYAINGTVLPGHRDGKGHFNDEMFWQKFELLARYPTHMIASLGVNSYWFECRVRKLFMVERLGNG